MNVPSRLFKRRTRNSIGPLNATVGNVNRGGHIIAFHVQAMFSVNPMVDADLLVP
jgi:hypothetical protein